MESKCAPNPRERSILSQHALNSINVSFERRERRQSPIPKPQSNSVRSAFASGVSVVTTNARRKHGTKRPTRTASRGTLKRSNRVKPTPRPGRLKQFTTPTCITLPTSHASNPSKVLPPPTPVPRSFGTCPSTKHARYLKSAT